jgi:hypothetical protein
MVKLIHLVVMVFTPTSRVLLRGKKIVYLGIRFKNKKDERVSKTNPYQSY